MAELDADLHYLARGYVERVPPEYFVDEDDTGIVWQPDVYPETLKLARASGQGVIIDLGCGRAGKLVELRRSYPNIETIGVDFGANISWCRNHFPDWRWLDVDLETATELPLDETTVARSVVVCSDVLEHLVNPRPAMLLICSLLASGAACAVLSTPARDRRAGTEHLGPPSNPSHAREWTRIEFSAFVESFPVVVDRFELTRSDDGGGGLTTQLVVLSALDRR